MIRWRISEVAQANGFKTAGRLARESRVSYATIHRLWKSPHATESVTLDVLLRIAQTLKVRTADLWEELETGDVARDSAALVPAS